IGRAIFLAPDQRVDSAHAVAGSRNGERGPGRLAVILDPADPYRLAGILVGDDQRLGIDRGDRRPDAFTDADADTVLGVADRVRPRHRTPLIAGHRRGDGARIALEAGGIAGGRIVLELRRLRARAPE